MGRYAGHDRHPHLSWQATAAAVLIGAAAIWLVVAATMSLAAHGAGHGRHGHGHEYRPQIVHVAGQQGDYQAEAWVLWRGDRVQLVRVLVGSPPGVATRATVQVLDADNVTVWQQTVTRQEGRMVVVTPRVDGAAVVVRYGWEPSAGQLWAERP